MATSGLGTFGGWVATTSYATRHDLGFLRTDFQGG